MTEGRYQKPAGDVDMVHAERAIRRAGVIALVAMAVAVPGAYYLLPPLVEFPVELPDRLAFAARASVFVLIWVLIGVFMVSTGRRFSPADIHGSASGPPSERIATQVAFLQNTLEQAVLAVGLYFALATLVSGDWLSLIVVGIIFFWIGRILFLRGYHRGVPGRALGMTLTMLPTALGYLLVIILIVLRLFD